jgi:YVTN family beta-propeller protein
VQCELRAGERSGTQAAVDIIDVATLTALGKVEFLPKGLRPEQVTPVDVLITKDGTKAYVALGRANHVAVIDVKSRTVLDYLLVGKRPWGLKLNKDESLLYVANGLSDDVTIIETASSRSLISVPVGQVPYGMLIDDE